MKTEEKTIERARKDLEIAVNRHLNPTAEEMFKELDYLKDIDYLGIIRYKKELEDEVCYVIFEDCTYSCWKVYNYTEIDTVEVDKKLHKAITKQMEELEENQNENICK